MFGEDARPLAERMRPQQLDQVIGQQHLVGPEGPLRQSIEAGQLPSIIFWGPPGVGKTTLANVIAHSLKRPFHSLSAISSGVKDLREVIEKSKRQVRPVLFIDEIHRFNKGQQDALLSAVEKGQVTLIGATTENPSFEVNAALLSRCQVYVLEPLGVAELQQLVDMALAHDSDLQQRQVEVAQTKALFRLSGGDARRLLNLLELTIKAQPQDPATVTDEAVLRQAQQTMARYDKTGEQHYDIISAFIKSIRGSDPNAAVYYLARMIEGGEDIKFIARRLVIAASEDIGNANPTALVLANSTFQAVNVIGFPESRILLSQCTVYLASSPKSNASYQAINKAQAEVRKSGDLPVPLALRNAPTKLMRELNYGKDYQYAHAQANNFAAMEFLPEGLEGTKVYEPGNNPREEEFRRYLRSLWKEKYGY